VVQNPAGLHSAQPNLVSYLAASQSNHLLTINLTRTVAIGMGLCIPDVKQQMTPSPIIISVAAFFSSAKDGRPFGRAFFVMATV
jgi:hypothetical protein